ncbi:MAG: endonuclease/exonuclease/phosphatase family protein [Anaerolineae bacterium]|jgi:endonuclease/exonuclease/phosphatase family metal-dependent hydrolase
MRDSKFLRTIEATALFLFLLQSVRVLFSVLFGVIYDTVFEETFPLVAVGGILLAVVAALLTPLTAPRRRQRWVLSAAALLAALARVPVTFNFPSVRLWASIVVIAAAGLYTVLFIGRHPDGFAPALAGALAADQFLRTAGSTFDLSLRSWWWPVQLALAVGVGYLGWRALAATAAGPRDTPSAGLSIRGGLAIGTLLFLETSLLNFPNGVARWSGTPYEAAAPLLMAVTILPLFPVVRRAVARFLRGLPGGLGLLFIGLAGVAVGRVVGGVVGLVGLLAAQFLLVLVLFDLAEPHRWERTRLALALGSVLFLVLNFALAFAFTYPYTIPAFRGMGLPVILIAVLIAALPALRPFSAQPETASSKPELRQWLGAALIVAVTAFIASPCGASSREAGPLRVGTYNVHYGYNTTWQLKLEEMARTIEESGADVVMLQEVDTCRITSYGIDNAFWLARRLGMRAIYQPTLETLSGIALLTRFPVDVADGTLLTSELEQTGIVHARLRVGEEEVDAYGVWLGLERQERARQLTDALDFIADASPALLGGDLNSVPDSPVYNRLVAAGFADPFVALELGSPPTSPAIEPQHRVDYVWGRGLEPDDGAVLDSLASDHRMVITEWRLP